MKKISIIGIGKLGLCFALNLEKNGFEITGVDINEQYTESINKKTLKSSEKGVEDLLIDSKNIYVTTDINEALKNDIIFIFVATPSLNNGKYDHTQIENVINQLEKIGKSEKRKILVIGCTTFPGYCISISERLNSLNYSVIYNPEFIAQGDIIYGQKNPDIILIGESNKEEGEIIEYINKSICENKPKVHRMSLTEAELTKLSINCFITTKISFANMIGDVCNILNISHENVLNAVGSDSRINNKYLKWGYGFGGPCFPRDNRALGILCKENNIEPSIPYASDDYNKLHVNYQSQFIYNNQVKDNKFKFDSITYKKCSNIIEESQQLRVAEELCKLGVEVTIEEKAEVIDQILKISDYKFNYEKK